MRGLLGTGLWEQGSKERAVGTGLQEGGLYREGVAAELRGKSCAVAVVL